MKYIKVEFGAEAIMHWFLQKEEMAYSVSAGLPPGSELIDIIYDPELKKGVVIFEHELFENHESLLACPLVSLEYQAYHVMPGAPEKPLVKLADKKRVILHG